MAAAIVEDASTIDPFATNATDVTASRLRECMVLMDPDLGTPLMWLDHRLRSTRNSGDVKWMAHNLDTGRLETLNLRASADLAVLATGN